MSTLDTRPRDGTMFRGSPSGTTSSAATARASVPQPYHPTASLSNNGALTNARSVRNTNAGVQRASTSSVTSYGSAVVMADSLPSTSSATVSSGKAAVPAATPLDNHFYNLRARGVAAGHWKHFTASTTIGEKEASILIFEKKANVKAPARLGRINRLGLVDLLRYDVGQLVQLAHPRIVRALHPLAENKEMIAFACEPMAATLDQLIVHINDTTGVIGGGGDVPTLCERRLEKLEIKLGVLQLIEGLSYLHNSAKILHGNLTPSAVFVTAQQQWKIGNFAFSVIGKKPNVFPCFPWTKRLPPCLQPDLDFLAPEYLDPNNHTVTTAADVFSLGVLICWVYGGGRRLIDVKSNLESYQIVVDQLDVALGLLDEELSDANLKQSLAKVLSKEVEQRPLVQMLALIKHFDDPQLAALRQLDDIAQEFDPANKTVFLSHSLLAALPNIPEPLWFSRVLQRFSEHLFDSTELYPAMLKPLAYILSNCESHNIHRLRPWFRLILDKAQEKALSQAVLDNMAVIFRRLSDEQVEDRCFDLLIFLLFGPDPHLKQTVLRTLPQIVDYIPLWFINKKLIPTIQSLAAYFEEHIPRQIDLLVAVAHLSDRCDTATLQYLLTVASVCNALHPAVVHSKSRLVQRILTCDVSRLRDPLIIAHHLLNPMVLGLALPEMSPAHFDDVLSSSRILLDIIEQLRYESDEFKMKNSENGRRLCNRRVSMSSNHLPRLLITAARPSFGGDGRKMSFLSADGRLEDRGSRRESKDSRCSLESDVSLRIGNGSDVSDESALLLHIGGGGNTTGGGGGSGGSGASGGQQTQQQKVRRRSWLEGYMHSVSLEQQCGSGGAAVMGGMVTGGGGASTNQFEHRGSAAERMLRRSVMSEHQRTRTLSRCSPSSAMGAYSTATACATNASTNALGAGCGTLTVAGNGCGINAADNASTAAVVLDANASSVVSKRPNSFTNLGHNLACTLWKTFH